LLHLTQFRLWSWLLENFLATRQDTRRVPIQDSGHYSTQLLTR
jgi:hypothetical protein